MCKEALVKTGDERPGAAARTAMIVMVAGALAPPLQAQPEFTPEATAACTTAAYAVSPGLSDYRVLECVGRAAQACMMTPGGDTTIGMIDCLDGERGYWDARLNAAYAERLTAAGDQDRELRDRGSAAASIEDRLRDMQRTWIAFRDAACLYEQSQWMGGTGGGPATMACHMQETARQALKLEGWWQQ